MQGLAAINSAGSWLLQQWQGRAAEFASLQGQVHATLDAAGTSDTWPAFLRAAYDEAHGLQDQTQVLLTRITDVMQSGKGSWEEARTYLVNLMSAARMVGMAGLARRSVGLGDVALPLTGAAVLAGSIGWMAYVNSRARDYLRLVARFNFLEGQDTQHTLPALKAEYAGEILQGEERRRQVIRYGVVLVGVVVVLYMVRRTQ